ncbi:unnamed protein product [Ixodes persulcatus]
MSCCTCASPSLLFRASWEALRKAMSSRCWSSVQLPVLPASLPSENQSSPLSSSGATTRATVFFLLPRFRQLAATSSSGTWKKAGGLQKTTVDPPSSPMAQGSPAASGAEGASSSCSTRAWGARDASREQGIDTRPAPRRRSTYSCTWAPRGRTTGQHNAAFPWLTCPNSLSMPSTSMVSEGLASPAWAPSQLGASAEARAGSSASSSAGSSAGSSPPSPSSPSSSSNSVSSRLRPDCCSHRCTRSHAPTFHWCWGLSSTATRSPFRARLRSCSPPM